jgi:hypothetical protein
MKAGPVIRLAKGKIGHVGLMGQADVDVIYGGVVSGAVPDVSDGKGQELTIALSIFSYQTPTQLYFRIRYGGNPHRFSVDDEDENKLVLHASGNRRVAVKILGIHHSLMEVVQIEDDEEE